VQLALFDNRHCIVCTKSVRLLPHKMTIMSNLRNARTYTTKRQWQLCLLTQITYIHDSLYTGDEYYINVYINSNCHGSEVKYIHFHSTYVELRNITTQNCIKIWQDIIWKLLVFKLRAINFFSKKNWKMALKVKNVTKRLTSRVHHNTFIPSNPNYINFWS